jgi:diguanylate cyclase (GGDEF)-like protein
MEEHKKTSSGRRPASPRLGGQAAGGKARRVAQRPAPAVPRAPHSLKKITALVQQINCLDIELVAEVCVNDIRSLVGARLASLYVLDEASDILHLTGYNHKFPINNIVSLNQSPPSPMVTAVRTRQILLVDDIDKHNKPVIHKSQRQFAKNYKTKSCVIAPLVCQDRVIGVLNLSDKMRGERFTAEDIEVIELFRQLVGASIGNIKLFEKTQRQAKTDGLTGLANHRTFYETLERELRRSHRYGGKISVIMIDVDNLKSINDTYGHRAGDMAIKKISRKITECIRQIDTAARYGGDEFAVILPNTMLEKAVVVGERMVELVAKSPLVWENQQITVSISVGLGEYGPESCPTDITNRSDEALYLAKQAGKNTLRIFNPIETVGNNHSFFSTPTKR